MRLGIFVSDAMPLPADLSEIATSYLKEQGIEAVVSDNAANANTPLLKAKLLHEYLEDSSIDAVMAFWGGLKTIELLPYLNFDLISKFKKPIIGYSDTTVLLQAIGSTTSCPTYHGPALITFAKPHYRSFSVESLKNAIGGTEYVLPSIDKSNIQSNSSKDAIILKDSKMRTYRSGESSGISIAGNLQSLLLLNGTKYEMDLNEKIIFIEEAEEANENWFRRFLSQLILMRNFTSLRGMVISKFTEASNLNEQQLIKILDEYGLKDARFPIVINADSGHCDPILTVPNFVTCKISAIDEVKITFPKGQ
jgi:muramoyltetrapeptide carboxypeptidase